MNKTNNKTNTKNTTAGAIKNNDGGLKKKFLTMTTVPILLLGIVIIIAGSYVYEVGINKEVENGLSSEAHTIATFYDEAYSGDYNLLVDESTKTEYLRKGDVVISENFDAIDRIKEETGIDITLFFGDRRMMTTVLDGNGNRVINTYANKLVVEHVIGNGETIFAKTNIGGTEYYAEYAPLVSKAGDNVGIIAAAKSSKEVNSYITQVILYYAIMIVLLVIVVALVVNSQTAKIVKAIDKTKRFMNDVADGRLDSELDPIVVARKDEIGDIGRYTLHMRSSLRKLVERDPLTSLYNRRSGMNKITAAQQRANQNNHEFCVAMGDIDFFKKVNDTYGHEAGDLVLKEVARILGDGMFGKGFAARWGGEEFLLVFEKMSIDKAKEVLESTLDKIRATEVTAPDGRIIKITMSFGIVDGDYDTGVEALIAAADDNLYYSKSHGRNQITAVLRKDMVSEEETE